MNETADDPELTLARYALELADGIEDSLAGWVVRCVETRIIQWSGEVPEHVRQQAESAGQAARDDVAPRVRELLLLDIDEQPVPPLSILRAAVRYPAAVLADAGVAPVVRDEFDEAMHPDDIYDLAPANFADIDPRLHEAGIAWGASKAFVHLARRRAEGQR